MTNVKKLWHDIPEFSKYQVTRSGRVRSKDYNHTKKAKELSPQINKYGYRVVHIYNDYGCKKLKTVSRLVATTFIPNTENKPQVNHKDSNRINDHVNNLEWVTISENAIHAFKKGNRVSPFVGRKPLMGSKSPTARAVKQFSKDGKYLKTYGSLTDAARATGALDSKITMVCDGRRNHAGGFKWQYVNPEKPVKKFKKVQVGSRTKGNTKYILIPVSRYSIPL